MAVITLDDVLIFAIEALGMEIATLTAFIRRKAKEAVTRSQLPQSQLMGDLEIRIRESGH